MKPEGTIQQIQTSLTLGIQFDEFDFRLFLRDYHRELRSRFPEESFPAYSPSLVLNSLIDRYEDGAHRHKVLSAYAQRAHRLQLALTGSDYGPLEQRVSPYSFDRAFYHLGREMVSAQVQMEYPGYNPYRSTRKLSIAFVRDHLDEMLELLPDYLWWAMHDQRDIMLNILAPEHLEQVRRRIELAGFKLDNFGLYLSTHETLLTAEEVNQDETNEPVAQPTA